MVVSFLICLAAVALEAVAAGRGVNRRFSELSLPRFSPPFGLWVLIGLLYYVICWLILQRLLGAGLTRPAVLAFPLLISVMVANAGWNYLFFRRRSLRASFLAFLPYDALVVILAAALLRLDRIAAAILLPYLLYLCYATWWVYRLWRLNP